MNTVSCLKYSTHAPECITRFLTTGKYAVSCTNYKPRLNIIRYSIRAIHGPVTPPVIRHYTACFVLYTPVVTCLILLSLSLSRIQRLIEWHCFVNDPPQTSGLGLLFFLSDSLFTKRK